MDHGSFMLVTFGMVIHIIRSVICRAYNPSVGIVFHTTDLFLVIPAGLTPQCV